MNRDNIFKDAKFGDIFIDIYGHELKFIMSNESEARLLEENNTTGRQYVWSYDLDGTNFEGKVEILHKATQVPMTEEYLLDKGFIKDFDETTSLTRFDSPNKKISVWFHPPRIQSPYNCYVHIVDYVNNFREIRGSLEIAYVDEFEAFLKLCGVDYGEK